MRGRSGSSARNHPQNAPHRFQPWRVGPRLCVRPWIEKLPNSSQWLTRRRSDKTRTSELHRRSKPGSAIETNGNLPCFSSSESSPASESESATDTPPFR